MTDYAVLMGLQEHALRTRVMLLESVIAEHRREVRDGVPPKWKPPMDPNERLWSALDNEEFDDG